MARCRDWKRSQTETKEFNNPGTGNKHLSATLLTKVKDIICNTVTCSCGLPVAEYQEEQNVISVKIDHAFYKTFLRQVIMIHGTEILWFKKKWMSLK